MAAIVGGAVTKNSHGEDGLSEYKREEKRILSMVAVGGERIYNDFNGNPVPFGLLYMFEVGSDKNKKGYLDAKLSQEHTNPVVLDEFGGAVIYWRGNYKLVLFSARGEHVWTAEPVVTDESLKAIEHTDALSKLASATGGGLVGYQSHLKSSVSRTVEQVLNETASTKDFGIHTDDDPSVTRKKMNEAIAAMEEVVGRPKVLYMQGDLGSCSSPFNIDGPIIMRSGISLKGEGRASIRNIRRLYDFYGSSLFVAGNFHPDFVERLPRYGIDAVIEAGTCSITLANSSLISKFIPGLQVIIQSVACDDTGKFRVPQFLFLNKIKDISGNIVKLMYPIGASFEGVVSILSEGVGRNGNPLFFLENSEIAFLNLHANGYIHADSATYGCHFHDWHVSARSIFYGNTFQNTVWERIYGACGSMGEMSLCSYNCSVRDFSVSHDPEIGFPSDSAFMGFQENSSNIRFSDGVISTGSYKTGAALVNLINANKIRFSGVEINAGNGARGSAIQLAGSENKGRVSNEDNLIEGVVVRGSHLSRYVSIKGNGEGGKVCNNKIINSLFYGNVSASENLRYDGVIDSNVVSGCYFEAGRLFVAAGSRGLMFTGNDVIPFAGGRYRESVFLSGNIPRGRLGRGLINTRFNAVESYGSTGGEVMRVKAGKEILIGDEINIKIFGATFGRGEKIFELKLVGEGSVASVLFELRIKDDYVGNFLISVDLVFSDANFLVWCVKRSLSNDDQTFCGVDEKFVFEDISFLDLLVRTDNSDSGFLISYAESKISNVMYA
ncbi:hypothetical protein WAE61_06165 [Comamonadaceae bacterium PP-2]